VGKKGHCKNRGLFFSMETEMKIKVKRDELSFLVIRCHVVMRGRWCNIIALNVHAPSEEKSDD